VIDLAVIIFAYNERENIAAVLGELCAWLKAHERDWEVVFVDDGSKDGTFEAAAEALRGLTTGAGSPAAGAATPRVRATLLRHEDNRGIGAALKTGIAATEARWVTFMPADGQIEPDAIGTLREAARHGDVDVVLSVYDHRNDGFDRKVLSFGVRALITLVHGVRLRSDGPYLFRRGLFDPGQLKPDTFFLNFEFPIRVLSAGLPTRTVTIRCRPRIAGVSKSTGFSRVWGVAKDLVDLRVRRLRGE
jgi:glycosyltransferase involved in cell wall biosynthesis